MSNETIARSFFDESVRLDNIIHVGSQLMDTAWPFDIDIDDIVNVFDLDDEYREKEDLIDWLVSNKKLGFIVSVSTPVPSNLTSDSYSCSWSYFTTEWLYSESFEDICNDAIAWKESYLAKLRNELIDKGDKHE